MLHALSIALTPIQIDHAVSFQRDEDASDGSGRRRGPYRVLQQRGVLAAAQGAGSSAACWQQRQVMAAQLGTL